MQPASSGCSVIDLPRSTLSFVCLLEEEKHVADLSLTL
jgi:hypothetical protein